MTLTAVEHREGITCTGCDLSHEEATHPDNPPCDNCQTRGCECPNVAVEKQTYYCAHPDDGRYLCRACADPHRGCPACDPPTPDWK